MSLPTPSPQKIALNEQSETYNALPLEQIRHVGIIMDGNRRWAKQKNLLAQKGHLHGYAAFKAIALYANTIGLKYLTVYAFSTENWKRSSREVAYLLALMNRVVTKEADELIANNIRLKIIGDKTAFPNKLANAFDDVMAASQHNTGLTLQIALNYGGRSELLNSIQHIAQDVAAGKITPSEITAAHVESQLYTAGAPDVDLIIRTGGEQRLSNFLTWQSTYAEYWFTDTLWPDFTPECLLMAIEDYFERSRRFGK